MGSTDSIPQNNSLKLNLHNWEYKQEVEEHPHQYGRYTRLKNRMTGEQLIQYELYIYDKDQYTLFMSMCELRNTNPHLVNVSHLNKENIKELCSLIYHLKVYIEDFPLRLCNIKDIPFPQNLYVLNRALKGFSVIFQNVGHFHLTEDLICINEEGIIKVWMNQDLSKFFPNVSKKQRLAQSTSQKSKNVENSMVWEIITIVQQLTNKQTVPSGYSFIDFLHSERVSELDFQKAICLTAQYAEQTETEIPQFFQPVIRIMRERKGIYESEIDFNFNPRSSMKPIDQFNFSMIGNNFKQSKVQRIQSVENPSSKSYAGSQSHTFADNLKRFDTSFRHKQVNAFDKSYLRESPINKAADMILLQNNYNQRLTERIQKKLSYSSISAPKIQSLNNIGPQLGPRNSFQANSNAFSQIIQKNRSDGLTESQIPARVTPPTYFSHIIQPLQHDKMIKKQTLFSFGEDQKPAIIKKTSSNSKLIQEIQDVRSIFTSRISRVSSDKQKYQKPFIKFTYCSSPNLEDEKDVKKEQNFQQNSIPISPPSIDKSSTKQAEKVKEQKRNFFHSKEKQFQKKEKIQTRYRNQQTQTSPQYFLNSESLEKPLVKKKGELKEKRFEKINMRKGGPKQKNKKIQTENELGLDPEIYADLINYQSEILNIERKQR